MWRKYKDFLRKRTDKQLIVGSISAIFVMGILSLVLVTKIEIIAYIILIFISFFIMITFCMESEQRSSKRLEELERGAHERLRKELEREYE